MVAVTVVMLIAMRISTQQSTFITQQNKDIVSAVSKAIVKSQFSEEHAMIKSHKNLTWSEQGIARKEGIRTQKYMNGTGELISKKIENDKNLQAIDTSDGELVLPNVLLIGAQKAGTTAVSISW